MDSQLTWVVPVIHRGYAGAAELPNLKAMSHQMHDAAPAPPVRVEPGFLYATGRELATTGDEMATDAAADWTSLTAAGGGSTGWAAGAAAEHAARQWHDMLLTCSGEITELGDRFAAAAEAYHRCDTNTAARHGELVPR